MGEKVMATAKGESRVTKMEVTLHDWGYQAPYRYFTNDRRDVKVGIPADTWRDMGRPKLLTVTVETGDRLNEDE